MATRRVILEKISAMGMVAVLCLALSIIWVGCSKNTDPAAGGNDQNWDGRLAGDANANAVGQTESRIAAFPSVIIDEETGMLANKIFAVMSPSATVGQVNSQLDSLQARIICMNATSVFLTILIPTVGDTAELDSIVSRLAQSEPFLFVFPCFVPIPPTPAEPDPVAQPKIIPGQPAGGNVAHLKACRMPAAWNTIDLANGVNRQVTVLVPDAYAQLTPHSELPSQEFVQIQGDGADVRFNSATNTANGNHGFYVSGILGAEYDDLGATGIHPGNPTLIKIRSLNVGSDEWGVKLQQLSNAIPSANQTLVSTSLGYNDPTFALVSKWERIMLAFKWRELVGDKQTQFLHLTSSGNDGRLTGEGSLSVFNSPFTMAGQMDSPWDWLGEAEYTEADSLAYVQLQQFYGTTKPYILQPLTNVLVIGSSRLSGVRSAFSNVGADVRFVGERVFSPCVTSDPICIDGFGSPSGTSMATPQAGGLAAYLMNLQANLTPLQAKQIILDSYDNAVGIVNAYRAVLSLDHGLTDAKVRKSILNVAGATGGVSPVFDEDDLLAFFGAMDPPPLTRDYAAWDLNGDGYTGGVTTAHFDLSADNPPAYSSITMSYCNKDTTLDENAMTDLAILKYYAYSDLYTGDVNIRDSLFECGILFTFTSDLQGWSTGVTSSETGCCNSVIWQFRSSSGGIVKLDGSDGGTSDGEPNSWMFRTIDIPSGATTLKFITSAHDRDGASGALRVRLHDGSTFHTLLDWEVLTGIEGQLVWVPRQANITSFAGQSVTIYFEQGDNDIGVHEQRYIDNVSIR
jgi:Subtilase family